MRPALTVSRGEAQQRVAGWLARESRALAVLGGEGTGKTSFVRQLDPTALGELAPRHGAWAVAVHICDRLDSDSWVPSHAIHGLSAALRHQVDGYAEKLIAQAPTPAIVSGYASGPQSRGVSITTLNLGAENPAGDFLKTITNPLVALAGEGRLRPALLVIDALDEASRPGLQNLMAELAVAMATSKRLPQLVRVLVTSRPEPAIVEALEPFELFDLAASGAREVPLLVVRAVEARVGALPRGSELSTTELGKLISERTHGNFFASRAMIEDLLEASTPITAEAVLQLPATLADRYRAELERLLGPDDEDGLAVLGVLTVARRPLAVHELAHAAGVPAQGAKAVVEKLAPLLWGTVDPLPDAQPRYALIHASLVRFLQDRDLAGPWWRDETAQHTRIATALLDAAARAWDGLDDYGLRHVGVHAALARPQRWREVLGAGWITATITRLGPSATLAALADLDRLPELAASVDVTFAAGMVALEVRDHARYLAEPHVTTLLIRANGLERTAGDLGALPESDWHRDQPLVEICAELLQRGREAEVRTTLDSLPAERRNGIAVFTASQLAERDPASAKAMLDLADHVPPMRWLCRALAAHDEYVADALAIAAGDARCLMAMAEVLGHRDPRWALHLLSAAEPYRDEDPWGIDKDWVTSAELQLRLAEQLVDIHPTAARLVFARATGDVRPALGLISVAARQEPLRALELAGSLGPIEWIASGLASAMVAEAGGDMTSAAEQAWERLRADDSPLRQQQGFKALAVKSGVIAAGVLRLERLRCNPTGSAIALSVLDRLVSEIVEAHPEFEVWESAVGTVGSAIAVFDTDRALAAVERLTQAIRTNLSHSVTPMRLVVERVMKFDPDLAWELCDEVQGPWEQPSSEAIELREEVLRRISERSPDRAIGLLTPRLHPEARARLAGALAVFTPEIDARKLLVHLPAPGGTAATGERRDAIETGLNARERWQRLRDGIDRLGPGEPVLRSDPAVGELVAGLDPVERSAALVELARLGILADAEVTLRDTIVTAIAAADALPHYNRDKARWFEVVTKAAGVWGRIDLPAVVSALIEEDRPGFIRTALEAVRDAGRRADANRLADQLVEEAAAADLSTWLLLGEILVTQLDTPPSPELDVWTRLPADRADVLRAMLLLPRDEERARALARTALAGHEDLDAWFNETAIDVFAQVDPERAIELTNTSNARHDMRGFRGLARRDPTVAWARALHAGPHAHPAMVAVIGETARRDWRWAADRIYELGAQPGNDSWLERDAVVAVIEALAERQGDHTAACDEIARWITEHIDNFSSRVTEAASRIERPTPAFATAVIRAHMNQPFAYAKNELNKLATIAASAGGEAAVKRTVTLLGELARSRH